MTTSIERGVSAGKMTADQRDEALARLSFTTDLDDFEDRQLVVEAIVEDEAAKIDLFRQLDEIVAIATRSSPPTPRRSRS